MKVLLWFPFTSINQDPFVDIYNVTLMNELKLSMNLTRATLITPFACIDHLNEVINIKLQWSEPQQYAVLNANFKSINIC